MHNVIFAKEQDCAASLMIMEGRFSVLTPFEILNDADSTQTQSKSKTKQTDALSLKSRLVATLQ